MQGKRDNHCSGERNFQPPLRVEQFRARQARAAAAKVDNAPIPCQIQVRECLVAHMRAIANA